LGDSGLLLIFGNSSGVVGKEFLGLLSLGKGLLVRFDKHVLQVRDLNLVFSLVLEGS
jgi:hypothetical protein